MDIIKSYDKLPLGRYMTICEILQDREYPDTTEGLQDQRLDVLAALAGCTRQDLERLPLPSFMELSKASAFLDNKPGERNLAGVKSLQVGAYQLTVTQRLEDITVAQYVDFQAYSQKANPLVEVLSCFLVPEGCSYGEGYDPADVQAAIREGLDVVTAAGLYAFFFDLFKNSMKAILTSLKKQCRNLPTAKARREAREATETALTRLSEIGDGLTMSQLLLKL